MSHDHENKISKEEWESRPELRKFVSGIEIQKAQNIPGWRMVWKSSEGFPGWLRVMMFTTSHIVFVLFKARIITPKMIKKILLKFQ